MAGNIFWDKLFCMQEFPTEQDVQKVVFSIHRFGYKVDGTITRGCLPNNDQFIIHFPDADPLSVAIYAREEEYLFVCASIANHKYKAFQPSFKEMILKHFLPLEQ